MVMNGEKSGQLDGKTILEATSGNTGIALAMIGAARGYRVKLCMPECVSLERQHVLQVLGAEVVLTPAKEGTDGTMRRAHELLDREPQTYYMPNQFANESNMQAHYETAGPEILSQTSGAVDAFVAGMGTTGTLTGVGKFLKSRKSSVKIVGVEPTQGHTIQELKNMTESIVPPIYNPHALDEKITVENGEAFEMRGFWPLRKAFSWACPAVRPSPGPNESHSR